MTLQKYIISKTYTIDPITTPTHGPKLLSVESNPPGMYTPPPIWSTWCQYQDDVVVTGPGTSKGLWCPEYDHHTSLPCQEETVRNFLTSLVLSDKEKGVRSLVVSKPTEFDLL